MPETLSDETFIRIILNKNSHPVIIMFFELPEKLKYEKGVDIGWQKL